MVVDLTWWIIVGILLVIAWVCARIERKLKRREETWKRADYEDGGLL